MERLEPAHYSTNISVNYTLLQQHVWCREGREQPRWVGSFQERFGLMPPGWVSERTCLIHGDPTRGNLAWRGSEQEFVLLDPKPVGRGIPSFRSVDIGKMLQSLMGWEMVLGDFEEWCLPHFPLQNLSDDEMRRAIFWCAVHFMRIRQREGSTALGVWAHDRVRLLGELIDMRLSC